MTAKEFLTGKKLQAIEVAANVIINLVVDDLAYCLAADTTNLKVGTQIVRATNFKKVKDVITYGNLTLDLATAEMM